MFGDIHGGIDISKLNTRNFPEQKHLTRDDYVIILGDFGLIWDESEEILYWRRWLENKPFTVLFIDGNHENFDLLNQYPVVDYLGGKAHKISENIYHLMRGEIFTIDGNKYFCMGGAESIDKENRQEHISWWKEEIPSYAEMKHGMDNLEKHGWEVDYILTHCYTNYFEYSLFNQCLNNALTKYFDTINWLVTYKHWYFGHYHIDRAFDKYTCLYLDKVKIEPKES